jgi:hypothetical protein
VVAIGGSVTTGMGALRSEDAYTSRIVAWLRSLGNDDHPVNVEVCRLLTAVGPVHVTTHLRACMPEACSVSARASVRSGALSTNQMHARSRLPSPSAAALSPCLRLATTLNHG